MSRLFNGSSDKLRGGSGNSNPPFSMVAWIYPTSLTGNHAVWALNESGVDSITYYLLLSGSSIYAIHYDGDSASSGKGTLSLNTWHHVAGVFASEASRTVYLDGVAGAENTIAQTAGTVSNYFGIGILEGTSDIYHFAGRIAESALYNRALTAAEVLQLSKEFAPSLVRVAWLAAYLRLRGIYTTPLDVINGPIWTLTGTTKAAHPRIFYPEAPRIAVPAAAAVYEQVAYRFRNDDGDLGAPA